MQNVTVGRTVLYRMLSSDCEQLKQQPPEQNNEHEAGQLVPALVLRVWGEGANRANLRVSVDGNATLWKTSICEGPGVGQWQWPEREPSESSGPQMSELLEQLEQLQKSVAVAFRERDEQNEAARQFRTSEQGTDTTGEAPAPAGERQLLPGQIG